MECIPQIAFSSLLIIILSLACQMTSQADLHTPCKEGMRDEGRMATLDF